MRTIVVVLVCALLLCSGAARGQAPAVDVPPPPDYKVTLASGDTLTGALVSETAESIVLRHPVLGLLTIPKTALAAPPALIDIAVPEQAPPPSPWSGTLNAGLTGVSGNSNNENFVVGFKAQHKTEERVVDLNVNYKYAQDSGETTEDQGLAEARVTWPDDASPWGTFVQGTAQRDRFADYDYRLGAAVGRSYDFIDTEMTWFQGRAGLGASKDIGGEDQDVRPEGLLAVDWWHKLSSISKVTASAEYYSILNDLWQYRGIARVGWESKLAEASPWIFKAGIQGEHDRTAPSDVKQTDWTYFAGLGYTF